MSEYIEEKTADDVWKTATKMLLDKGSVVQGRTGEVLEILHTFITIESPRQKWIFSRIPTISIAYALAELVWILNGEDRSDIINYWNPNLRKYAGNDEFYYGAYGKRIRFHFKFDQLEKAYYALKANPETRQVVIQIYDTKVDFPIDCGKPRSSDIPCNVCSLIKVRDGRLEWSQIMRSNDVLFGMPYDFIQFTSLQEILAGWLGMEVGTYNHYSDSLHLYNRDIEKVGIRKEESIENTDSLSIPKEDSELIFKEIYKRMKLLALSQVTENEIYELSFLNSEYIAYNNIMYVLAAYVAQKYRDFGLAEELMNLCSNELYKTIWNRWMKNEG